MSPKVRTALVAAGLALLTAVLVFVFVLRLAGSEDAKVQLGDAVFEAGQVRRMAPQIERGGPLLYPDLLGRDRPIYIQHLGTDVKTGWLAIEAHVPGAARECIVSWDDKQGVFVDACSKTAYPADGTGLTRYPTEVKRKDKGGLTLFVDLRSRLTD